MVNIGWLHLKMCLVKVKKFCRQKLLTNILMNFYFTFAITKVFCSSFRLKRSSSKSYQSIYPGPNEWRGFAQCQKMKINFPSFPTFIEFSMVKLAFFLQVREIWSLRTILWSSSLLFEFILVNFALEVYQLNGRVRT